MFVSRVGPRSRQVGKEERHGAARCIRLSAPLLQDQSLLEIEQTLAHEMIHQWQYDVKKRVPNHGPDFSMMMERMNRDGMGIAIRHSLDRQVEKFSKYLWRCSACGTSYRRQRRTLSPTRHCCGRCHGKLEEVFLPTREDDDAPIPRFGIRHSSQPLPSKDFQKPQQLVLNF